MAKYKPEETGQGYFITIYPEELFDDNSIEKVICKFIDEYADMRIFDNRYKNDAVGQKAISPSVKLKVILYGLSLGVESMRKVEKMLQNHHPGFLFLSGNRHIDHSTLCYFINDFQDEIKRIFGQLLMLMGELGLIDWRRIMIDGTKITSNASIKLTGNADSFEKKLRRYEELSVKLVDRARYVSEQAETGRTSEEDASQEKRLIERQQRTYAQIISKIKKHEKRVKEGKIPAEKRVNLTDEESSLLKRDKSLIQGYNVQAAFSANDVIVSIEAVSKSNDMEMLLPMVEKVEAVKGEHGVDCRSKYMSDKGYFNLAQVSHLIKDNKEIYVAPPSHFTENWFIKKEHEIILEEDGVYLLCKGKRKKKGGLKKNTSYDFLLSRGFCAGCENFTSCWENKDNQKKKCLSISKEYISDMELWFQYRDRVQTVDWQRIYNRRIGKEHNFHDLKSNNGLSRLNWRGQKKCNTISIMAGIAYNLKKFRQSIREMGWEEVENAIA